MRYDAIWLSDASHHMLLRGKGNKFYIKNRDKIKKKKKKKKKGLIRNQKTKLNLEVLNCFL